MKVAWQIAGLFFLFMIVMCITINERPIFDHIYGVISPATQFAQDTTEDAFAFLGDKTKFYSKKLFSNSVPKLKDSVKSKAAAPKRYVAEPLEKVTDEEKEKLDDLIKSH